MVGPQYQCQPTHFSCHFLGTKCLCEFALRWSHSCYRPREPLPTHCFYSSSLALWKFCLRDFGGGCRRESSRVIKVDTLNLAFQKKKSVLYTFAKTFFPIEKTPEDSWQGNRELRTTVRTHGEMSWGGGGVPVLRLLFRKGTQAAYLSAGPQINSESESKAPSPWR